MENRHENIFQRRVKREKGKRSDSILWQKSLHQQKWQKGKVTTQTNATKSSITERLRNLGQLE